MRPQGRRLRWLALALAAAMLLVPVSGAYPSSTIEAERTLELGVAEPENAYVVTDSERIVLDNGRHNDVSLLFVGNRLPGATVDASVVDVSENALGQPPKLVSPATGPDDPSPGDRDPVTADIVCSAAGGRMDPASETVTVSIEVTGPDVTVALTESVTVRCSGGRPGTLTGGLRQAEWPSSALARSAMSFRSSSASSKDSASSRSTTAVPSRDSREASSTR